jgi:hypothetical protein
MDKDTDTTRTHADIELLRAELEELRREVEQHRREARLATPSRAQSRRAQAAYARSPAELVWYLGAVLGAGAGIVTAMVLALGLVGKI